MSEPKLFEFYFRIVVPGNDVEEALSVAIEEIEEDPGVLFANEIESQEVETSQSGPTVAETARHLATTVRAWNAPIGRS